MSIFLSITISYNFCHLITLLFVSLMIQYTYWLLYQWNHHIQNSVSITQRSIFKGELWHQSPDQGI